MVLVVCIWAPVVIFTKPYIRHTGRGNQFMGFYTMTLGVLMGLAQAANFVTMYMFFEVMSLITMPMVLHNATAASRRAGGGRGQGRSDLKVGGVLQHMDAGFLL